MTGVPKIVLTGGPGGGKTSLINDLREDPRFNGRLLYVPESATQLILMGLRPGSRAFQESALDLQRTFERSADRFSLPGRIAVCDRGTLDSLAYWRLLGEREADFYGWTGLDRGGHLANYHAVIHLETTAIGAESHYARCDHRRPESLEEAVLIDRTCLDVWGDHPRYHFIGNGPGGWSAKSSAAREVLLGILDLTNGAQNGKEGPAPEG